MMAELVPSSRLRSHPRTTSPINGMDSANWSGVIVTPPSGAAISAAINGVWNVPDVTSIGPGQQHVSAWIGIDGLPSSAPGLLQAGISVTTNPNGSPACSAWAEWLTVTTVEPPMEIANFPIKPGDSIEVQIWVTSAETATAVMRNLSTKAAPVIVPITNNAKANVVGATAEWVVERPALGFNGNLPVYATLADYSPVTFTEALAWSQPDGASSTILSLRTYAQRKGASFPVSTRQLAAAADFPIPVSLRALLIQTAAIDAGSGNPVTMLASDGTALSTVTILNAQTLRCQYAGPTL